MSKKRKMPKGNVVWRQSVEDATLAKKPHYNGFACGHGAHGDVKYNRTKAKRTWKQQLRQEGAPRGSFLFYKTLPLHPRLNHSDGHCCHQDQKTQEESTDEQADLRNGACGIGSLCRFASRACEVKLLSLDGDGDQKSYEDEEQPELYRVFAIQQTHC